MTNRAPAHRPGTAGQIDVEEAIQEYEVSRRLVHDLRDAGDPRCPGDPGGDLRLREAGDKSIIELINVQLDFNDKVKQYLDTAIRYRGACSRSIRWSASGSCRDRLEAGRRGRGEVHPGMRGDPARDRREETMGRRIHRGLRPDLEAFERRELLSAITAVLAYEACIRACRGTVRRQLRRRLRLGQRLGGGSGGSAAPAFASSISLGGTTLNQGPAPQCRRLDQQHGPCADRDPEARAGPAGSSSRRGSSGPYSVVPGRTTHPGQPDPDPGRRAPPTRCCTRDIQIRLVTPTDPSLPIGGVSSIFDRNINSNTALGLRPLGTADRTLTAADGPTDFPTVTIDANISAGAYVEGYGQGAINIRYIPSGRHTPGVISQGTAIVTIHAQIYSANASFLLRNVDLNP